jgi:hypothetical protein
MNTPFESAAPTIPQPDATKLAALLGLAAGAVALPQTGQADIIYTDLSSSPVSLNYSSAPFWFSVPGTAQVGFFGAVQTVTTTPTSVLTYQYRMVLAVVSQGVAGGVGGSGNLVQHLPSGATWDEPANLFFNIPVGYAGEAGVINPGTGYNNRYLAWWFVDDSLQTPAERYGWAEINLNVVGFFGGGPTVTVLRYAYDNTGAKPTMGQLPVPEPASGALFALGAMALGARGLRQWRQNRQPVKQA